MELPSLEQAVHDPDGFTEGLELYLDLPAIQNNRLLTVGYCVTGNKVWSHVPACLTLPIAEDTEHTITKVCFPWPG